MMTVYRFFAIVVAASARLAERRRRYALFLLCYATRASRCCYAATMPYALPPPPLR